MHHGPRERTPIPRPQCAHHVFSEAELAAYVTACGARVVEFRGHLWRNSYAPNPISAHAWTPLNRWVPLDSDAVGYPNHSALAYRALAAEAVPTAFPYTVFRDVAGYWYGSVNRHRARHIRQALARFEYRMLESPELLLAQGWPVVSQACAFRGTRPPESEGEYRRRAAAMFEGKPPVIWTALADGRLVAYMTSYATGSDATLEKLYISPSHRDGYVGLGMYWVVLVGWANTPGVRDVWAGGTMPGGIDQFKISMGAVLEHVPVHAGMRLPVRLGYKVLKPGAMSLTDLHA